MPTTIICNNNNNNNNNNNFNNYILTDVELNETIIIYMRYTGDSHDSNKKIITAIWKKIFHYIDIIGVKFIIRVRVRVINPNPNKMYGEKDWEIFLYHIWKVHIWGIPL